MRSSEDRYLLGRLRTTALPPQITFALCYYFELARGDTVSFFDPLEIRRRNAFRAPYPLETQEFVGLMPFVYRIVRTNLNQRLALLMHSIQRQAANWRPISLANCLPERPASVAETSPLLQYLRTK